MWGELLCPDDGSQPVTRAREPQYTLRYTSVMTHRLLGLFVLVAGFAFAQNRVYELRTYTCNEGKLEALKARFRDHTVEIFKRHGMESVGYWIPQDPEKSKTTLIYILVHPSLEAAKTLEFPGISRRFIGRESSAAEIHAAHQEHLKDALAFAVEGDLHAHTLGGSDPRDKRGVEIPRAITRECPNFCVRGGLLNSSLLEGL